MENGYFAGLGKTMGLAEVNIISESGSSSIAQQRLDFGNFFSSSRFLVG